MNMLIFFNTPQFLFFTIIISVALKAILLGFLIPQIFRSPATQKSCFLLVMVLVGSMFGELAWAIKLTRLLFAPTIPYSVILFSVRWAWAFLVIQYQALSLFIKSLIERKFKLFISDTICLSLSTTFCLYYIYLAFFDTQLINEIDRNNAFMNIHGDSYLEIYVMRYTILYILCILVLPSLYKIVKKIRSLTLPKILQHQMVIIFKYLFLPYLVTELLIALHSEASSIKPYTYAIVGFSALLLTYIVYYCIRHVMGLRFLNFTNHVQAQRTFNFVDDFKVILDQLSSATTTQELAQITSTFFKQAFDIPLKKIRLNLRNLAQDENSKTTELNILVEEFCMNANAALAYLSSHKIFIYDELVFSNFYEEDATRTAIIEFLQKINADIFIPIFEKERISGFIIVEANSRPTQLYSNIEQDEMLVFVSYLNNIINLLHNRNPETLILQEKELKEELYKKNQEIIQYKESIRSFLKNAKHKEIGIIFYKNRRFICANQIAREMIKINLNTQEGHPLTRSFKQLARQVEEYKSPQTILVKDLNGTKFILSGVTNLEQNNVILTISYPEIADIITKQIGLLNDPSKWDYLLYLETTKPGQLINQLVPGHGEMLLNFKISLLQTALSKKATLLEIPEEDLIPMVELLHHISMRETLHVLKLARNTNSLENATKLFGVNPIFGNASQQKPLLESLDGNGTLFIQNIDYLDLECQEYLAEFIQLGYYHIFKSEHKVTSSVRIICSATRSLEILVQEGIFSTTLFNELKKCSICMPSLQDLPDIELSELALGYTEQAIKTNDFKNLLELTEKERLKLMGNRPVSLKELKTRVQQLLLHKSKKNNIEKEIQFNPAYEISDPLLIQASRLGKHALRDSKIMGMLWSKFRNQNKIATFLGVNRSSVNRRCKEFNFET